MKILIIHEEKNKRNVVFVVVQFLLWNNLFLNWDKIV